MREKREAELVKECTFSPITNNRMKIGSFNDFWERQNVNSKKKEDFIMKRTKEKEGELKGRPIISKFSKELAMNKGSMTDRLWPRRHIITEDDLNGKRTFDKPV